MIELSFTTAFMLYLGITLVILLGLWGYHHYRDRHKIINTNEQKLVVCEYCGYAFLDNSLRHVNKCPQCQSYVKDDG